jgi:DNA-binding response OmpR family regulator
MRIVLVDDDADTHEVLTTYLESEGFDVLSAYTGPEGIYLVREHDPDLVILDIELPYMDGWDVCQRIRSFSGVPILMITAVAREDTDIVRGLDIGADDYLLKPIRLEVLKARVRALLRRSTNFDRLDKRRSYVDTRLVVDLDREQVQVEGQRISLSFLEYRLLRILVINIDRAVPMLEIVGELWSENVDDGYARYVRIYIQRLRSLIEPDPHNPRYIVTEHGFGYRFSSQI